MAEKSQEISWVWDHPKIFMFFFKVSVKTWTRTLGNFLEIFREISLVPGYLNHSCQIHAHLHNKCNSHGWLFGENHSTQHLIDLSHIIHMPFAYAKACKEDTYHTYTFQSHFVQGKDLVWCGSVANMPTRLPPPPTHRVRSKSAPRGRSPDPKALKKAAAKHRSNQKKVAPDAAFVTPPPKPRVGSPGASDSSRSKGPVPQRKISFGENSVHSIEAENPPPKDMAVKDADKIFEALKDSRL